MKCINELLKQKKLLIAFIVLAGITLRFYGLGDRSLWFDESLVVLEASKTLPEVLSVRAEGIHPPLFRLILHFLIKKTGTPVLPLDRGLDSGGAVSPGPDGEDVSPAVMDTVVQGDFNEYILRLPSVFFSLIAVILVYMLGRVLFGVNIALLTAGIMSISAFQVHYAQEIKMYALLQCVSLTSCLLLISALRSGKRSFWIAYSLINVLAFYTHYFTVLLLAGESIFVLIYFYRRINREFMKYWLGSLFLTAVLFLPWVMNMSRHLLRVGNDFWLSQLTWRQSIGVSQNFFWGYYTGSAGFIIGKIDVFILCLLGMFCLSISSRKIASIGEKEKLSLWDNTDSSVFVLCGALIPVLCAVALSFAFRPVFFDRPLIFTAGYYYLLFSCGLCYLWRKKRIAAFFLFAVFCGVSWFSLRNYYSDKCFMVSPGVVQRKPLKEMCAYITRNYRPDDIVVLSHYSIVYPLACYLPKQISGRTYLLESQIKDKNERSTLNGMMETSGVKMASWRQLRGTCRGLWVICSGWNQEIVGLPKDMTEWLSNLKLISENSEFRGEKVYYYELKR